MIFVFFIGSVLKTGCQLERTLDVARVCRFVSSAKENDDFRAVLGEVGAVSWPEVNAHFADAFSHWSDVTRVSLC